jgi:hypothetical protein
MHIGRGDKPPGDQYLTQLHKITALREFTAFGCATAQAFDDTKSLLSQFLGKAKRQGDHLHDESA